MPAVGSASPGCSLGTASTPADPTQDPAPVQGPSSTWTPLFSPIVSCGPEPASLGFCRLPETPLCTQLQTRILSPPLPPPQMCPPLHPSSFPQPQGKSHPPAHEVKSSALPPAHFPLPLFLSPSGLQLLFCSKDHPPVTLQPLRGHLFYLRPCFWE